MLFDAPSAGLGNYRAILFDADNPLRPGFFGAVQNTAVYTFFTVGGTLVGGLAVARAAQPPDPRAEADPHADADAVDRAELRRRAAVAVHVAERRRDRQQDPRRLHGLLGDAPGVAVRRGTRCGRSSSRSIWRGLPFAMLIFFAGLQAIPPELAEAAAIDGAGPWRRFRHITLPLLRPLIAIQLLFGVIYAAYQYAIPVVMLGSTPGPDADLMMTLIVRQSFQNNLFGFGAAASVLLTLAMFVWVGVWWRTFRRDLEVGGMTGLALSPRTRTAPGQRARSTRSPGSCWS